MNETQFFSRISRRLGRLHPTRSSPVRDVVGSPDFWMDYQLPQADCIDKFSKELEKLGGHVATCNTIQDLHGHLLELLHQLSARRIGAWGDPFWRDFQLDKLLGDLGDAGGEEATGPYDVIRWKPDELGDGTNESGKCLTRQMAGVDVGITGCDFAIADTGTVVLQSGSAKGRSVSLLPAAHIVLIKADQIKTRMGEVWQELLPGTTRLPSSVNFISGPSRTSDIENDLIIGVHGPAAVFALVLL